VKYIRRWNEMKQFIKQHKQGIKFALISVLSICIGVLLATSIRLIFKLMEVAIYFSDKFPSLLVTMPKHHLIWMLLVGFIMMFYVTGILFSYICRLMDFSYKLIKDLKKKVE